MDLTTKERVKVLTEAGGHGNDSLDTLYAKVITEVSAAVEKYLDRYALEATRTETLDVFDGQSVLTLRGYPVNASPAPVVKCDAARAFGSDSVVSDSLYAIDHETGQVLFDGFLPTPGPRVAAVTYKGGMAADVAGFVSAYPDIAGAVDLQVATLIQRRGNLSAQSAGAGSGNAAWEGSYKLLAEVTRVLDSHARR